ncbi:hypothetical protein BC835DRAFT_1277730 [Cytidiella melzeri]|nr:hypothetical protein BC835DRAFT_1277730 [Cytidiella melzeri]
MAQFASSSPQLERGKACLRCRRRKMRCDGQRPTCNQCTRSNILDCEYTDEGPTASQILEQHISYLEARIRELEGDSGSITLHDPHARNQTPQARDPRNADGTPFPFSSSMQTFVSYAPEFGFFLHLPRFLEKLKASIPPTPQSPLPAALVHATFLFGVLFSAGSGVGIGGGDDDLTKEVPQLLKRAEQALSAELDPSTMLYTLQAEVLLGMCLYHMNSRISGNYHAAAAMSIAVGCKLHKLRSSEWMNTQMNHPLIGEHPGSIPDVQLFPPMDDIEEGERIRAFWTIFTLDRCLVVVCGATSLLAQQGTAATRVDTPWPLEMSDYEQHLVMPQGNSSARTIEYFLDGLTTELPNQSLLCLRAKAAILFERSSQLAEKWNHTLQAQFVALDARIEQVKAVLPALVISDGTNSRHVRELLFVYTLCYVATLQLHAPFGHAWDVDRSKALNSAVSAARLLQSVHVELFVYADPLMGVLWNMVGQTLANALANLKRNMTYNMSQAASPQEVLISTSLAGVLNAMNALRGRCPLIGKFLIPLPCGLRIPPPV